jgi:hypothetical protein
MVNVDAHGQIALGLDQDLPVLPVAFVAALDLLPAPVDHVLEDGQGERVPHVRVQHHLAARMVNKKVFK